MTLQERRRQSIALEGRLKSAREQLTAALHAMDYEQALVFQVKVDELQDEISHRLVRWHSTTMKSTGPKSELDPGNETVG
jgi:hypothetical protein